jgi:hypothetical protein
MREEIANIKKIYDLLQKYYSNIEELIKIRFIHIYDIVNKYFVELTNTMKELQMPHDLNDLTKFRMYHLLNLSWLLLQKIYQNISFVIDEDPDNTSKSEGEKYLIKLKEMTTTYSTLVLKIQLYDTSFLESIDIQSQNYKDINTWFRSNTHSIPLYVFISTKLIDKYFKEGNRSEAKKIIDLIELDKTFILDENSWNNSFLSYGLLPETQIFDSVDALKHHYFKSDNEDDTNIGEILFIRMLPSNNNINLYLPQKTWMPNVPLDTDQIKESKIVNIQSKKSKDSKLSINIEIKGATADKFVCIEQIEVSSFRLLRYFHYYEMNKKGGWKYDPTMDSKNPAFIPWEQRPENKEKAEQQKKDREQQKKYKSNNNNKYNKDEDTSKVQKPPVQPYVPKERLQKILTNASGRPDAYNNTLERTIIESHQITKTQIKISEVRIDAGIVNNILIEANKITSKFYSDISKKYNKIYDITNEDIELLSTRIAKAILSTLKLDVIDSHLYYINDFQNIYTKEFIHISRTETKNAGLTLKMFSFITDKIHTFLFKPNSKFIKLPMELSNLKNLI